eukprot:CAMPEP_0197072976 /NCGR_PEP_ID=MMETSP1384-20130603/210370_1 /TAXON_ID=29189 /ORGANISM="Ammonia sp." /LENGTH=525 /DNA_ID=CAMNT_0042511801 /DNA_START=50 /DNA_END=1626 /DNA_ORIENTATION=-
MLPAAASLLSVLSVASASRFDELGASTINEYDTYNADECQRIRRPWHKLSTAERNLYTSGLLQLRKNGNGNLDDDELISIGTVHEDPLAFMHQTSAYLFWHGYLVWELESRIRNLGGKWKCFGMPYWDFTAEAGRESEPFILDSDIGGDGDANDYWTVNEYSWSPTIQEYWVPNNCIAAHDEYPFCSLKRALRSNFAMPSAKLIGDTIIGNPGFVDFAAYSHASASAIHLIDDHPDYMDGFPQGYEPIWYLFHSAIQFHQALWTDCNEYDLLNADETNQFGTSSILRFSSIKLCGPTVNEYDLLNADELERFPQAFTPFCNSYNPNKDTCDTEAFPVESPWYGVQFELDDRMHFGGTLKDKEWSYIHSHDVSVRKLYMIPKWNVIYDLDDGQGFYADSGVQDWCKGKLNQHWFMTDLLEKDEEVKVEQVLSEGRYLSVSSMVTQWYMYVIWFMTDLLEKDEEVKVEEVLSEGRYLSVSSMMSQWYMYVIGAVVLVVLVMYYVGSSPSFTKIYDSNLRRAGSYGSV